MPVFGITVTQGASEVAAALKQEGFDVRVLFWPDSQMWDVLVRVEGADDEVAAAEERVEEIADVMSSSIG
jgi:DNA primase